MWSDVCDANDTDVCDANDADLRPRDPMPMPTEYRFAGERFLEFVEDARVAAGLQTSHQTYTMVQGVMQTFRRRLTVHDAIRFADVLPPVVRAIFVADWDSQESRRPFGDRAEMMREVQSLRRTHNYAPDSAIRDVAAALRRHVDEEAFDRALSGLPPGAAEFWTSADHAT